MTSQRASLAASPRRTIGTRPADKYSFEIAEEICSLIPHHREGMGKLLALDDRYPSEQHWYKWVIQRPEVGDMLARAREQRALLMEEEILEISDDTNADAYITQDKAGNTVAKIDGEAIQRSKLKVDTRRFLMSKLAPRVYGDKLDLTTQGEKITAPQPVTLIDARIQSLAASVLGGGELKALSDRAPSLDDLMD